MAIRVVTGPDYIKLQLHPPSCTNCGQGETHDQQTLAVQEAARTAPGVSAAQRRRNMLTHDSQTKTIGPEHERKIQRLVYKERKKVQQRMLQGANVDDKFGSLTTFAEKNR